MTDRSFFFDVFLIGGSFIAIVICNILDKIEQHDDEIRKLNSRLEKKHESSQDS